MQCFGWKDMMLLQLDHDQATVMAVWNESMGSVQRRQLTFQTVGAHGHTPNVTLSV